MKFDKITLGFVVFFFREKTMSISCISVILSVLIRGKRLFVVDVNLEGPACIVSS